MAELMFYQRPVKLNREQHRSLSFEPLEDFRFSAGVNSVPLLGVEFFEASRSFPILFSRDDQGRYFPVVLLSLKAGSHDCVDDNGRWLGFYQPAFIRRYPFALSDDKDVCFDADFLDAGAENPERALFDNDGENTSVLDGIIAFLGQYDEGHRHTMDFCDALAQAQLFKSFDMQLKHADGRSLKLDGLFAIDEQALQDITPEQLQVWFKSSWLAWVYAHLHSIPMLTRLPHATDAPDSDQ